MSQQVVSPPSASRSHSAILPTRSVTRPAGSDGNANRQPPTAALPIWTRMPKHRPHRTYVGTCTMDGSLDRTVQPLTIHWQRILSRKVSVRHTRIDRPDRNVQYSGGEKSATGGPMTRLDSERHHSSLSCHHTVCRYPRAHADSLSPRLSQSSSIHHNGKSFPHRSPPSHMISPHLHHFFVEAAGVVDQRPPTCAAQQQQVAAAEKHARERRSKGQRLHREPEPPYPTPAPKREVGGTW